jgi:hypothetical protein
MTRDELLRHFEIRTREGYIPGFWFVKRKRDGKIMTQDREVKECLRWLNFWGPEKT